VLDYGGGVCCLGSFASFGSSHCVCQYHSQLKDGANDSTDPKPFPQNLVATLLASLQGLLNGTRQPLWEVAAQVLGAVLGSKQFRSAVWKEEHCISGSAICSTSRNRADVVV
jgi:hypothetical protein